MSYERKRQRAIRKSIKNKKRDYPFEELAIAGVIISIGGVILYYTGVIQPPYKKVRANCNDLGSYNYSYMYNGQLMTATYPYDPMLLANALYKCMTGLSISFECKTPLNVMLYLDNNQLRCLHNIWRYKIDKHETLYSWINREWSTSTTESNMKWKVLQRLNEAGVGENIRMY